MNFEHAVERYYFLSFAALVVYVPSALQIFDQVTVLTPA